jgi:hypothetical protein
VLLQSSYSAPTSNQQVAGPRYLLVIQEHGGLCCRYVLLPLLHAIQRSAAPQDVRISRSVALVHAHSAVVVACSTHTTYPLIHVVVVVC